MLDPSKKLILILILLIQPFFSDAQWAQGKGSGYANLSFTYLTYQEVIQNISLQGGTEHYPIERTVSDHTLNGYLEYGLTDRTTLIGSFPFKILSTGQELHDAPDDRYKNDTVEAGNLNAWGNIRLGVDQVLHAGSFHLSARLMGGMKTASYKHSAGLRSGYDAWYLTPQLRIGKGWGKWYYQGSIGYRYKSNGYADDLIAASELGYKWKRSKKKNTWFVLVLGGPIPITSGSYDDRNSVHTALFRDGEGFVESGLKIEHQLNGRWALNLSMIGALWARHGGNEFTYTGGVAYDW